ncbi:hypothetical protein D0T24_24470 [Duganella sp. BJB480]|uniref:type III secretion protein HrpB4 n=1 Tax=unclassified Duganella TaxID=2636909 RepID=UPI000E34FC7C|nr:MULTISPECIES: type III secretion protein HrpB4 [unclassified Duganella]RFP09344.1 hypothetical protein D0T23_26940 [Duganella sp. BJB475]RFP13232.1 hypothetical protein D0T26_23375 [Duganella sp. BJB489]RFP25380.1 hypothetical protein D0T21_27970 [Duganella sp. BJB476]RFP31587.1 hypothetical protein D0T24_24470 [Duganella sp. BJB480]
MNDTAMTPVAALLRAYEQRLLQLDRQLDPSWLPRLFDADAALAWHLPASQPGRLGRLRAALRLAPLAPAALARPANRLALLEPALLWRVLAARALYARRAALRRCIDRAVLEPLRALLGADALQLLQHGEAGPGPAVLPVADAAGWAWSGHAMLLREQAWTDPTLRQLIALVLPAEAPAGAPAAADGDDGADFVALLPALFPEAAWLFG